MNPPFAFARAGCDYSGQDAEPSDVREALAAAKALLADVKAWLRSIILNLGDSPICLGKSRRIAVDPAGTRC